MKEFGGYLIGFILFITAIAFAMWIAGDKNRADINGGGGYEPCITGGHPLWQDC